MENKGCQPNVITCKALVNGLCKTGQTGVAIRLLRKMEEGSFELDLPAYNTNIDSLSKDRLVIEALNLFI